MEKYKLDKETDIIQGKNIDQIEDIDFSPTKLTPSENRALEQEKEKVGKKLEPLNKAKTR